MAAAEITTDKQCRVVLLNGEAERLTGWSTGEAKGRPLPEIFGMLDPLTRQKIRNVVEQVLRGDSGKILLARRDGAEIFVEGKASPILDANGKINGVTLEFHEAAEHEAISSQERLRFIDRLNDAVFQVDAAGRLIFLNPAWEKITRFSKEECLGNPLANYVHPLDAQKNAEQLISGTGRYEIRLLTKNGGQRWVEVHADMMRDSAGKVVGLIGALRDIGERKTSEQQLRLAASVFEHNLEGIFIADKNYIIVSVNPAFCTTTGYSPEEIIGQPQSTLRSRRHDDGFYQLIHESIEKHGKWHGEVWNRRKNGEIYPELLAINAIANDAGETTHYIGISLDITERKLAEEQIHQLAYFDTLTGLPNRLLLMDRLEMLINQSCREEKQLGVLCLDLDHFKEVNDTLGHAGGDILLQSVAHRLNACVREGDTVARLGGDEFVIIVTNLSRTELGEVAKIAALVAEKVKATLSNPFIFENHEVLITPSIGIALYSSDADNAADMIKCADAALYHAKSQGRNNYQFYAEQMNTLTLERLSLQNDLRKALERNELEVHYQPQVDIGNGFVTGMEALMRWKHPTQGWIPPVKFIPIAEETGLILSLGEWLMKTVCAQMKVWQMAGLLNESQRISINVSPRQFKQGDFSKMLEKILNETALSAHRLELEMTEGMLMHNTESTLAMLNQLKLLGVKLSLDDFGTGYSSLSYLKRFPLDVLKIDQSFVRDITDDPNDAAIVTAIIAMARSLKLKVIAEGVETLGQFSHLKDQGCHGFQGYYFSKPIPGESMTQLFQAGTLH
ncbi:MAG: EAL domain-containing protein [Burkholderiales bacterium]|nr:EAL domain-containing protein [Burkholderiales bacterium]